MKNIKYLFLFFVVSIAIFYYSGLSASIGSYSQTVSITRRGSSASQVINTAPFGVEKQVYSVDISGNYDGHGAFGPSGGKYGISVCINNVGAMWNGSCWNVIDPNGAGNIGDASGSIPGSNVNIGATSNNFNYFSADVYVNDADANVTFTMYGREVSINGFNTTNSTMAVGGQFDITWNATERTGDSELTYSGPVNCDVASGASVAGDTNGTTCTGTAVGTATFNLQATGYGGYGDKNVYSQPINVNIISPPVSCGNGVIESGEQCDSGVNNGSCPRTCSNSCTINSCSGGSCGNGVIESGEQCDSGVNNGSCPRTCSNSCTVNNSCSASTAVVTFTASGPGTALAYTSSAVNQPLVYAGSCRNATCNMTLPVGSYIAVDAVHDVSGGPFVWTPVCPAAGVGNRCYGLLNGNVSGGVTFTGVTTPTTNNVTISSPMVTPNGTTQYTVTHSSTDPGGASKITYSYALLRDSAGVNKGILAWHPGTALSPDKNYMACTGGGNAAILSTGTWAGTGDQYIRLISCNTSSSGNSRTTNFVMVFEPLYNTTLTGNDIWGITYNTNNNYSPWTFFDTNFGLNMPTVSSVVISPSPVTANNSTQHTITVVASDPTIGTNITQVYALTNHQGSNVGQYRGYLTWGISDWWPADKNRTACTGGGWAVIQSTGGNTGYGHNYLNLDSCSTSTSGNNRTVSFVVRYDPSFISPTNGNTISSHLFNTFGHASGWIPGTTFNLVPPLSPTLSASPSTVSPGGTVTLTFANVPVPTVRDWIGQYVLGNTGSSYIAGTQGWKYVGASPCTQTVPATSRSSGTCTFTVSSTPGNYNFRLWDNDNILVQHAVSNTITVTTPPPSVTLSASPTTITSGGSSTLTWTVSGSVTSCTASGSWSGAKSTSGGSQSTGALVATQTYNLSCTGPGGTTNVTPVTVTVTAPTNYTLTVSANPGPGGRITGTGINCGSDCSENVTAGSPITLTAVPASSYWRFAGWGGACSGTNSTCNLTINANTNVTATFVPRAFIYREF